MTGPRVTRGEAPDIIYSTEACQILGVHLSTLSRWVAAGKLAPIARRPHGNAPMLFDRAAVEKLARTLK